MNTENLVTKVYNLDLGTAVITHFAMLCINTLVVCMIVLLCLYTWGIKFNTVEGFCKKLDINGNCLE